LRVHNPNERPNESEKYFKDGKLDEGLFIEHTKMKIRIILIAGMKMGYKRIVLGALGCGAFINPSKTVAMAFKSVLEEEEFKGKFLEIYFAILGQSLCDVFTKILVQ